MDTTTEAPTSEDPPPEQPAERVLAPPVRRLVRSTDDRMLGGVAAGIADYFSIDPLLVRLGFVVTAFFGGIGVLAYIVGWIAIPTDLPAQEPKPRRDNRQLIGFGLIALGLVVVPGSFGFGWGGTAFWPVTLIAIGVAVLWLRARDSQDPPPDDDSERSPPPADPPTSDAVPSDAVPSDDVASGAVPSTDLVPAPGVEVLPPPSPPPSPGAGTASMSRVQSATRARGDARAPRARRAPRPKSHVTAIALSVLLVLAGGAWLLDLAGWVSVDIGVVFALALAVVGIALVASAWFGRARGLIALGILLALVVGAFGVIDVPLRGGIGDKTYRPNTIAAVDSKYEMAIGRMTLDLRRIDFSFRQRTVGAALGIGKLEVIVPEGVRVVVDGHAGAGSVRVFGDDTDDCCPNDVRAVRRGDPGGGTLLLEAEVGAGAVEIRG